MTTRRLSICQPTLCGDDVADDLRIARTAGVDAVAVFQNRLHGADLHDVGATMRDAGITPSTYMYFGGTLDHADDPAVMTEGRVRITEAAALGAPGLLVVSGPLGSRSIEQADDLCRRWFSAMAPFAAEHGVRLLLEPLHPVRRSFSYVHRLPHAAAIIDGIANTALAVDTGHLWWNADLVADFRRFVDRIGVVQFTNVDAVALADGRLDRTGLEGDVPLPALLRAFDEAGYAGFYEFEGRADTTGNDRSRYVAGVRKWFERVWR